MRTQVLTMTAVLALSACGDPLEKLDKLSDVTLLDADPVRGALASQDEVERSQVAPLAEIFEDSGAEPVDAAAAGVEPDLAPQTAVVETGNPAEKPKGLFGRIFAGSKQSAKADDQPKAQTVVASLGTVPVEEDSKIVPAADGTLVSNGTEPVVIVDAEKAADIVSDAPQAPVELASLETEIAPVPEPQIIPKRKSSGLFGSSGSEERRSGLFGNSRAAKPRSGPDQSDVAYGTVLPFGQVARVCDAKRQPMGKKVETAGARGAYTLYDSYPDATTPRTFYVTGFSDGCPRQFTAALALFGAPELHEQLRYGRPSSKYPYSTTDTAYERVKSSVCRVQARKPCGAKIEQLARDTVFISTYERFTDNGRWADILIHDGTVLAAAMKDL